VVLFQLALALGAPWGAMAMGGKFPVRLPSTMRIAALAQAVSAILNMITPSKRERMLWAPVSVVFLVCATCVALS